MAATLEPSVAGAMQIQDAIDVARFHVEHDWLHPLSIRQPSRIAGGTVGVGALHPHTFVEEQVLQPVRDDELFDQLAELRRTDAFRLNERFYRVDHRAFQLSRKKASFL